MESWQKIYITERLPELLKETKVTAEIIHVLISEEVFSNADVEKLDAVEDKDCSTAKSKMLYDHLIKQTNGYKAIGKATYQSKQSAAFLLLLEGLVKHLLQESKINLNKDIIDEIVEATSLTDDALQFFNSKVCNGKLYEDNWVAPPYPLYVPRSISNRIKLQPELFKMECSDIFVFTGITPQDLSNLAEPNPTATSSDVTNKLITNVRFVLLKNKEDWDKLRSVWSQPVHLIEFDSHSGEYILQQSTQASEFISEHVPLHLRDKSLYYIPEDQFLSQIDNGKRQGTICICDTPGMGKTLLLENLARQARQCHSGRIIVVIGLQKFVQQTQTSLQNRSMNYSESVQILLRYLWPFRLMSTLLEKALENNQLQLQLFLDGFDEIPKEHLQSTQHLFASIAENQKNISLFVTSRPHMRSELEKTFQAVAYDILPFSEENQVDFLVSFWQNFAQHPMDLQLDKLTSFAIECLKSLNCLTQDESKIMGIPLLCYMLATVTLSDAELYCTRDNFFNINEIISLISLYDVYTFYFKMGFNRPVGILGNLAVETKVPKSQNPIHKTYFGNVITKLKLGKTTSTSSCTDQQKLMAFHTWKALQLLLPDLADDYRQSESISDIDPERILACGILQNSSSDISSSTGMTLLHRTFAEYLVAEHFSGIITTGHKSMNSKLLKKYLDSLVNHVLATKFSGEDHRFYRTMIRNFTSEVKTNLYSFSNPTIVYFLNASLSNNAVVPSNVVPKIIMELLTKENLPKIVFACITPSYTKIIQYFKKLLKPTSRDKTTENDTLLRDLLVYPENLIECTDQFIPDKYHLRVSAYLCQAAKTSNLSVLEELYSLFEECLHENLHEFCSKIPTDLVTPLHYAVERLDYTLVEFFTRQITLPERSILLYLPEHDDTDCQKIIQICELLFRNNNSIIYEQLEYADSLLSFSYCTHSIITKVRGLNLIKFLVQQGADANAPHKVISKNLFARKGDKEETVTCYNVVTINIERMNDVEFCELCRYLIDEIKAYKLFTTHLPSWEDPLPKIIGKVDDETLSSILQIPNLKVHGQDEKGNNWVLSCIQNKRELGFVKRLVDLGIDVFEVNKNGENALHLAVKSANFDSIEYLLSLGFSLEDQDNVLNTALHHTFPNLEIMKYLIKKNANVLAFNRDGDNIAHLVCKTYKAAKNADIELTVKFLLSLNHGAELFKMANKDRRTPFSMLVDNHGFPADIETVELLLDKSGVDLNDINSGTGYTMFMHGLRQRDSVPHLKSFIKHGANPHKVISGTSAIHISAGLGHLESVKYLVAIGVSLELEDCSGNTPLLVAAKYKHVEMLKYFISQHVNVLEVNYDGDNIAHLLLRSNVLLEESQKDNVDYLMTLTQAPELFKMKNNKGECPPQKCIDYENSSIDEASLDLMRTIYTVMCKPNEKYLSDSIYPTSYRSDSSSLLRYFIENTVSPTQNAQPTPFDRLIGARRPSRRTRPATPEEPLSRSIEAEAVSTDLHLMPVVEDPDDVQPVTPSLIASSTEGGRESGSGQEDEVFAFFRIG